MDSPKMPLTCKNLPELHQEVSRLRDGALREELSLDKSDILFRHIVNTSALTLNVYNIHGDLDHLVRIVYVAANVLNRHHMALFVVDQKHYDDAVTLLTKHFPLTKAPDSTMQKKDIVEFASFKVVRGGPENRKARKGSEEEMNANRKEVVHAAGRVFIALHLFGGFNKAREHVVPDFVWHNATSAELLAAMPEDIMKKHCKAVTFASGVILTPTSFHPGAHYSWDAVAHDKMVASAAVWDTPIVYYHGSTMELEATLSQQLPEFTNAVANLLPDSQWQRLLFESMDQVAVWLIRWSEGKAGRHGEKAKAGAIEAFSEIPENSRGWAKKVFEAKSYPIEECKAKPASQRAVSIAQDIRCPVNQSLGMAAGTVFDNGRVPCSFLVPARIDFLNGEVAVDTNARTYIMTSTDSKPEHNPVFHDWTNLIQKLHLGSKNGQLSANLASMWLEYTKCIAKIAVPLGNKPILDEIVEGEMTQLATKVLNPQCESLSDCLYTLDHSV